MPDLGQIFNDITMSEAASNCSRMQTVSDSEESSILGSTRLGRNRPIFEQSDASNVWCGRSKPSDICRIARFFLYNLDAPIYIGQYG
jgi:hypothetical protein